MIFGQIRDTFGAVLNAKSSSTVTYPAMWLMIKNGPNSPYKSGVHINLEQAKEMRLLIDAFIKEHE